jgi:nicotinamidase-related amidase
MTPLGTLPDTRPYPWPYDGAWSIASTAILLCGWQEAFAGIGDPGAAALAGRAADEWAAAGGLVVALSHAGQPVRPVWLPASGGRGATPLGVPDAALTMAAYGWDGCFGSPLEAVLRARRITHVLLAGLAAELTVDSTVRTLNDRGFECLVLTDACSAVDTDLLGHAQHSLTMSGGIFGALGSAMEVLDRLKEAA